MEPGGGGRSRGRGRGRALRYIGSVPQDRQELSRPGAAQRRRSVTEAMLQGPLESQQKAHTEHGGTSKQRNVKHAGAAAGPVPPQESVTGPTGVAATTAASPGMGAIRKALPAAPPGSSCVVPRQATPFEGRAHGTLGKPLNLIANHFKIELPRGNVYHYDVEVWSSSKEGTKVADGKKHCLSKRINRLVVQRLVDKYRDKLKNCLPAFDGRSNFYTRKELPFKEHEFSVLYSDEDREQEFSVNVKYAATVNLKALHDVYEGRASVVPQTVIQALDVIMRHGPCITMTPVGRSIFMRPKQPAGHALGDGHEVWLGYYTSVRPAEMNPVLNVDLSAVAFYEAINVTEFTSKLLGKGPESSGRLTPWECDRLSNELKDVKVKVRHSKHPRKYRVVKVTQQSAKELRFLINDSETTVADYFRSNYPNYKIKYPNFPCIQSGRPERLIYLPLEVCDIVEGQPYRKKLCESATTNMIRQTAHPPLERFKTIKRSVDDLVMKSRPYLDEFNIKVTTDPTKLTGRILPPPSLLFAGQRQQPRLGEWDLKKSKLLRPMPIRNWALLCVNCSLEKSAVSDLITMLRNVGGSLGMRVSAPLCTRREDIQKQPILQILKELKAKEVHLVIVVLGGKALYGSIKAAAEVKLGIRTQCIKEESVVGKLTAALIRYLCLKINAKLGGINNGLLSGEMPGMCNEPIIIIGADVTHPAQGERAQPSIAACVGSMDSIPAQYRASVRVQIQQQEAVARVEIIEGLQEMVSELLEAFNKERGCMPRRVIFYRDGVSEGQFSHVLKQELVAIRKACVQLTKDRSHELPVTFIVVQKRHHTRFMPESEDDGVGRFNNIPPGTIVDRVVSHPVDFDFFLCSHTGIEGTSRPARYCVVHDDSKFSPDDVQKLSYYLCHTYARCARSVSIPAPVYYAHLAAFRAKEHIASACKISSRSSTSSHSSITVSTEQYERAVKVTQQMRATMYFV